MSVIETSQDKSEVTIICMQCSEYETSLELSYIINKCNFVRSKMLLRVY